MAYNPQCVKPYSQRGRVYQRTGEKEGNPKQQTKTISKEIRALPTKDNSLSYEMNFNEYHIYNQAAMVREELITKGDK